MTTAKYAWSALLAALVVTTVSAQTALDQLKIYTESAPAAGKAAPSATAAKTGPPDIVGIRLGMPVREAYTVLQSAYPSKKLDTTAMPLPTIEKPVLDGFSFGFNPVALPDERINVNVTMPPNQQVVWRIQRFLGKQKLYRPNVIASLREKYGKETVMLIGNGSTAIADDRNATEMWWLFDEQWRPAKAPTGDSNALYLCRLRFSNYSVEASPSSFQPGNRWFGEAGVENDAERLAGQDWCQTSGIAVAAFLSPEEVITALDVEMFHVPLAVRSARAELNWLKGIETRQRQQELEKSKQARPKL
jgi:hypothetical protein